MTSTIRSTCSGRFGQYLSAIALMAGLAIGAAIPAGAERVWDLGIYDECMDNFPDARNKEQYNAQIAFCCANSGGDTTSDAEGWTVCVAPPPEAENVPGQSVPTEPPPVLQNPPAQPSKPVIPTPRGSTSGTLGST